MCGGSGFTLLELLITVGIFAIISGVLLANFRRSSRQESLRYAAAGVAADIQRLHASAFGGGGAGVNAIAHGMHMEPNEPSRYFLFTDLAGRGSPGRYDERDASFGEGSVSFPGNVRLVRIEPPATRDLLFGIPRGTLTVAPATTETTIRITLRDADGDTRRIVVNRISGQVSVE